MATLVQVDAPQRPGRVNSSCATTRDRVDPASTSRVHATSASVKVSSPTPMRPRQRCAQCSRGGRGVRRHDGVSPGGASSIAGRRGIFD